MDVSLCARSLESSDNGGKQTGNSEVPNEITASGRLEANFVNQRALT